MNYSDNMKIVLYFIYLKRDSFHKMFTRVKYEYLL